MPATASAAPKPAAPKAKTAPTGRAPVQAPPAPKASTSRLAPKSPAPALPAFARGALAPSTPSVVVSAAPQRTLKSTPLITKARPKIVPIPLKGEGHSPGKPLPPHIQATLENSFSIDLGAVRLHADDAAQRTTGSLSARAFTYGTHIFLGKGERADDLELMAHEAAHIVQQQRDPSIQRWSPDRTDPCEREADRASSAVQRGESFRVSERVGTPRVQRLSLNPIAAAIDSARDYLAAHASDIVGWDILTFVIGVNPITGATIEPTAENFFNAAAGAIPGGHEIAKVLGKYQIFNKVAGWLLKQIKTVGVVAGSILDAVKDFLSSVSPGDVLHLGAVWERAKRIFTGPIQKLKDFLGGVVSDIWGFIKDAILKPLASLAEGTPVWDLLLAVLGYNPITNEPVEADFSAVARSFMVLIHQEELWDNIVKAKAKDRIVAWFQSNVKALIGFVKKVPTLFFSALDALSWSDIFDLVGGFKKVAGVLSSFIGNFVSWATDATWTLLKIVFEVLIPGAMPYLNKLGASLRSVLKNPMGFVGNLVAAGKLGFQQFAANIGAHLKAAFIQWLTGSLTGVYLPKALDFGEIIKFVLSVLGLTWTNIRGKLVKVMGETAVKVVETGFDLVVTLVRGGPAAAWDKIKEYAGDLKDMAISAIMDYIVTEVVKKAAVKLAAMLVPGGAFISAIVSIYDTVMVFVSKLSKIIQVATAFLDSMMAIASGAIGAAAAKVESTLEGLLTLAISFLAGFLGLGKIADKVMNIINTKIRAPIDKALDKVIDWVAKGAGKFLAKIAGKDRDAKTSGASKSDTTKQAATPDSTHAQPDTRTEEQKTSDKKSAISDAEALIPPKGFDELAVRSKLGAIKSRYKLLTLDLMVDSKKEQTETIHFVASASAAVVGQPKVVNLAAAANLGIAISEQLLVKVAGDWKLATLDQLDTEKELAWSKYSAGRIAFMFTPFRTSFAGGYTIVRPFDPNAKGSGPYVNLPDLPDVGPFKEYSAVQKAAVIVENRKRNGNALVSDNGGAVLAPAAKRGPGVKIDPSEVNIDHHFPRSLGGWNSYGNARVLSFAQNLKKLDKIPDVF